MLSLEFITIEITQINREVNPEWGQGAWIAYFEMCIFHKELYNNLLLFMKCKVCACMLFKTEQLTLEQWGSGLKQAWTNSDIINLLSQILKHNFNIFL